MIRLLFILLIAAPSAYGEYRVFELVITNTQTQQERVVISNLDPFQYPGYYDLRQDEAALYRDTWMCYGDTSYHKQYCPNPTPNQRPAERNLASPQ